MSLQKDQKFELINLSGLVIIFFEPITIQVITLPIVSWDIISEDSIPLKPFLLPLPAPLIVQDSAQCRGLNTLLDLTLSIWKKKGSPFPRLAGVLPVRLRIFKLVN